MSRTPSPDEIRRLPADGGGGHNRLVHALSPYLMQHSRNPVAWYPWGEEALRRARDEGRPIFLSIGYSTCHWCHVMERESFEDRSIAALLNDHYVPIKVDREERPDLDEVYMKVTQALTHHGGWPNSLWLTPDGRPFYAGTYFPPDDRAGRPGFRRVLEELATLWRERRAEVESEAERITAAVRRISEAREPKAVRLDRSVVERALDALRDAFDGEQGGFGGAPKFPPHASLRLLLEEFERSAGEDLLAMATTTLDAIARGGIRDHVGGGFHRYATDERWFLPHFEKMLYDNALLGRNFVEAFRLTSRAEYREAAAETYDWVLREMQDPKGGFYSALDADSEGVEGKFYVWTLGETLELLGPDEGELFARVYDVRAEGNLHEEATGERVPANIPHRRAAGLAETALAPRLAAAREKLRRARERRVRPHLDDKVLAGWNGLMIGSLARASAVLEEARYLHAARRAADFVLGTLYSRGRLRRCYREERTEVPAYLDDWAYLAEGVLELSEALGDAPERESYRRRAVELMSEVKRRFADPVRGGYFLSDDEHETLIFRARDPYDQAAPSANGVAARVWVELARATGERGYLAEAHAVLAGFLGEMRSVPRATETLIAAAARWLDESAERTAAGAPASSGAPPWGDVAASSGILRATLFAKQLEVAPGECVEAALRLELPSGWYLDAGSGAAAPLEAHVAAPWRLDESASSPSEALTPQGSDRALRVHRGTTWMRLRVSVSDGTPPGPSLISVEVRAQPCGDGESAPAACLLPVSIVLALPVRIVREAATGRMPRYPEIFGADERGATGPCSSG